MGVERVLNGTTQGLRGCGDHVGMGLRGPSASQRGKLTVSDYLHDCS